MYIYLFITCEILKQDIFTIDVDLININSIGKEYLYKLEVNQVLMTQVFEKYII